MNNLDHYEKLARQYGSPNCWTGTTGTLAAAILELVTEIKKMTTPISNPIALVHRIARGHSAAECIELLPELDAESLERWGHFLDGAETALRAIGEDAKATEVLAVGMWIDNKKEA